MAIITISRGSASGGHMLAQGLAEKMGYKQISREDILQSASKYGVSAEKLQEALLKPPGFWERFQHERKRYLCFVQAALCEHAKNGRVIYHGNAGHILLSGIKHVLCVRIIAPLAFRIHMLMERENFDHDEAVRYIEKMDRQRKDWTLFLYGVDWLDPSLYDLTINLTTLDIAGAVDIVAATAGRQVFQPTPESKKAMDDLYLASCVRSALAADHRTASIDVEVKADAGTVSLKGRIRPSSALDAVLEIAGKVEGVRELDREGLGTPDYTV